MMLYFSNSKGADGNLYIDFHSIKERVEHRIPETTLYRMLQKRCKVLKYRNLHLYPFRELLEIQELAADLKVNEKDE